MSETGTCIRICVCVCDVVSSFELKRHRIPPLKVFRSRYQTTNKQNLLMAEMMRCLLDNTWLIDINQIFACKSIFKLDVKPAGEGLE